MSGEAGTTVAPPLGGAAAGTGATVAGETVAPPPVTKAAEPEATDEYEIDGKKVTLTRTQARTYIQKAGAVDKRMQETAEQKKKLDALEKEFESDPESALRKVGKDPEKILEALLARRAKDALLTPEQRERAKVEAERDALKADKEKTDKERKDAADKAMDKQTADALETQLIDAADKYGLDKTPQVLEGLCDVAAELLDYGTVPTIDQVVQEFIRRDEELLEAREKKLLPRLKGEKLKSYLKANVGVLLKLPPAELLELLGPEGIKVIQSATLTRVPAPGATKPKPAVAVTTPPARNGAGRFITEKEFNKATGSR